MSKFYSFPLNPVDGKFGKFYTLEFNEDHLKSMLQDLNEYGKFKFMIAQNRSGEWYIKPNVEQKPKTYTRSIEDEVESIPF
jgi:hypothetical protein